MPICLIAEPIHPDGPARLAAAGIEARLASCPALETVPGELAEADAVIVRNALPAAAIGAAPRLALIANHGTGTDAVDVAHAHALGIPVTNTPQTNVRAVAEHALGLMLAVARRLPRADAAARRGDARFRLDAPMHSLHGKTLGVIGFGRSGRLVCEMARAFGLRVRVWSPRSAPAEVAAAGAEPVDTLDELLALADVLSLHRPLRPDTRHTLDRAALAKLKPGAIVVNTSRGGLIDEQALAEALREGRLFGAGLDVFAQEPLPAGSPLAVLDNVVLTPHVAGSTQEALRDTALMCAGQVVDALAGRPPAHLLDAAVWARRRMPMKHLEPPMSLTPFHLAIPVHDLPLARRFYGEVFGCPEGRSSPHWVDFDFFGHQLVIHHQAKSPVQEAAEQACSSVDGKDVPVPHFGVVLEWDQWHALARRLKERGTAFVLEPGIRFEGQVGEQATMFLLDPCGNALEFKAFKDMDQLFAT